MIALFVILAVVIFIFAAKGIKIARPCTENVPGGT